MKTEYFNFWFCGMCMLTYLQRCQINFVCLIVITPWDWQDWGLTLEALPWVMKRFFGYWSPQGLRNPPPPMTEQIKATFVCFKNKEGKKRKLEGKRPWAPEKSRKHWHFFALESYLTWQWTCWPRPRGFFWPGYWRVYTPLEVCHMNKTIYTLTVIAIMIELSRRGAGSWYTKCGG